MTGQHLELHVPLKAWDELTTAELPRITATCPALSVIPVFLPDGSVGTTYSATLSAPAGLAPLAFALSAGSLPAGLTLAPSGQLGGTPVTPGSSSFTIGVTDAAGCVGSRAYTVDIFASPPVSSVAAQTAGLAISRAPSLHHCSPKRRR